MDFFCIKKAPRLREARSLQFSQHKVTLPSIGTPLYAQHQRVSGVLLRYHIPKDSIVIAAVDHPDSVNAFGAAKGGIYGHLCLIAVHAVDIQLYYTCACYHISG